jgi:hypothetical protein
VGGPLNEATSYTISEAAGSEKRYWSATVILFFHYCVSAAVIEVLPLMG